MTPDLGIKRKRTVNPRLLDDDNMSSDAIKRRKLAALKSSSRTQHEISGVSTSQPTTQSTTQSTSRRASVETVHDDEDTACHNAGSPKNSSTILESANDDDDISGTQLGETDGLRVDRQEPETEEQAETDEDELSKLKFKTTTHYDKFIPLLPARLQKDWRSKVYAFFRSDVNIVYVDNRKCHEFTCNAKHCKGKGENARVVRRYLDTKDKASTKSLRVHAIKCWGQEIIEKSEDAKNIASAREALKGAELRDGSIMAVFERTGKGKVTYSHRTHTEAETRYVDHSAAPVAC